MSLLPHSSGAFPAMPVSNSSVRGHARATVANDAFTPKSVLLSVLVREVGSHPGIRFLSHLVSPALLASK